MTMNRSRFRGATLIELMVSLTLLAVVLGVAVGLVASVIQGSARGRARGELARQGAYVSSVLGNELRMAGVGVPASTGNHIADAYAGTGATHFAGSVLVASSTAVGIAADLPRPDANYATFGRLDPRPTGSRSAIMWHNENNGSCAPDTVGDTCSTAASSLFFPGVDGCDATADANDRVCPWIVDGAHRWTHAGVASPLAMTQSSTTGALALSLSTTWDGVWANTTSSDLPGAVSGTGFVTTIDRVFFRLNGKNFERNQCWGDPDPDSASWPGEASAALPGTLTSTPSTGTASECTGWEVLAKNVDSVVFDYFDGTGAVTTTKRDIARIDWAIKLRKRVNGRSVEQDVVGSVGVRNR
jgi:hypothetical protein